MYKITGNKVTVKETTKPFILSATETILINLTGAPILLLSLSSHIEKNLPITRLFDLILIWFHSPFYLALLILGSSKFKPMTSNFLTCDVKKLNTQLFTPRNPPEGFDSTGHSVSHENKTAKKDVPRILE